TEYFQFTLGYSPLATGVRLLPFTMTPIFIAPLAGALSDRLGRRPLIVTGLALQAIGFAWVALIGTPGASLVELLLALFVAGASDRSDSGTELGPTRRDGQGIRDQQHASALRRRLRRGDRKRSPNELR